MESFAVTRLAGRIAPMNAKTLPTSPFSHANVRMLRMAERKRCEKREQHDPHNWIEPPVGDSDATAWFCKGVPVPDIIRLAESYHGGTPVNDLAIVLMKAWGASDPRSHISTYPASYVANFADMARAAIEWSAGQERGNGGSE